ncbi:pimeloyl-ACP methyl ester carboxylesterase [Variovorax boronicumulans]|uniref:Pimeloyl-ACP methyl ester carboxylesterase n=1 Tax=Variovorax boronicumulans TaxID=436515 RepID=A0AAW8DZ23_9BURK|nr:alpha/beta hydrolase [Variovorax boronicumulans]MDP9879527.1 pimeloyl-ACP methyl ester carboxylesterase [Variovorax boronicumulans]MDP9917993.1 pimeloyl-ACP methyl ester carboxylesterase [Variovorax boronicumulans]MDP9924795.1 pimeloyl-ACP methyl ester carboxylesterase [Variovorax boronicumulans]
MKVNANGLQIEVDDTGGEGRPVILLIMGLGMQLVAWPDAFVQQLVDAGFRVVRHDNRDIGLSQGFDHLGTGNLVWETIRHRIGLKVRSAYTLQDMALDSLGVLDALGIARAHIVGASMGGMIAQRIAATAPGRTASLVSIMSSSGARGLPGPRREVGAMLMRRPRSHDEAALVAHSIKLLRLIQSPAYPQTDEQLATRLTFSMRRAYHPAGLMRQMLAIGADDDRPQVLARIQRPTLVLHGDADALVPIACGRDSAQRIPGATFIAVPGMGHDLPPEVCTILAHHIAPFAHAADAGTAP